MKVGVMNSARLSEKSYDLSPAIVRWLTTFVWLRYFDIFKKME